MDALSERRSGDGEEFEPNVEFLTRLLEMGISQHIAEHALRKTRNSSLEAAATFALENLDKGDDDNDWYDIEEGNYKMAFVVNGELNMSIGKTAAQVAHGALGLYRELISQPEQCYSLDIWREVGEKKVVLKGKDENHLMELEKLAKDCKVPALSIRDAGLTELPENSLTVLALFGREEEVDKVTNKLRLL